MLINFTQWEFKTDLLPNTLKILVTKDFETLKKISECSVLDLGILKPFKISSLFFERNGILGVSPIAHVNKFYGVIDTVLASKNVEVIDYTTAAEEKVYFNGADSLVANFKFEIGLCGINKYTDESLFEEYCEDFELTPLSFDLPDDVMTSEMSFFIGNILFICMDFIVDKKVKKQILSIVANVGLKVIYITKQQVKKGVLNMKCVADYLVITDTAKNELTNNQLKELESSKIVLKEVFLPFLDKEGIKLRDVWK